MEMSLTKIGKWFGSIVLVAGIARIGMTPTSLVWGTDSTQELSFGFAACVLMALGSFGLFLVQRESGKLGFVSALSLVLFNAVTGCMVWAILAAGMSGDGNAPFGDNPVVLMTRILIMAGMFLGTPAFAYATFRAKVFPRWIVWLLLLAMIGPMLPGMEKIGAAFWGLSYVGMGWVMITGKYAVPRE
ncbi:hypothetical protein GE107_05755 [Cohnella sp. CFH 77786]|uniref:hypothetical protein n=1 Tax=Cohnella sp. CFH 77786 TaxID=2662265 RepID=UPI001C60B715|nr:hypothetical protein [Cohnella sp. CFH 77786]MBW5445566.1 hypothetical protein [Cohnella sp. CFH 77786]